MHINFEFPDRVTVKCAGRDVDVDVTTMAPESIAFVFRYGFRVMGDRVNGAANAAKKAGAAWLPSDFESAITDVVKRLYDGTIAESARGSGGVSLDPIAKEAHALAKAFMLKVWKAKTGEATIAKMYAARDTVRDFFTESDGRYTWREDKVAEFIDANEDKLGFRADAERIMAKRDESADIAGL
jgi:hypothetical protein